MDAATRMYVVVSGPPASGKSTLAPQIAAHLGLPLLAKDVIKDALMRAMPPSDVERRVGSGVRRSPRCSHSRRTPPEEP